ncbi:MAG TPA: hypothetical protein VD978_20285 [Azospirillum sp.]|nr:hypothetical protein [Azospirillum sp.]
MTRRTQRNPAVPLNDQISSDTEEVVAKYLAYLRRKTPDKFRAFDANFLRQLYEFQKSQTPHVEEDDFTSLDDAALLAELQKELTGSADTAAPAPDDLDETRPEEDQPPSP